MKLPATVGGDERRRLFCALTLPEQVVDRVLAWQEEVFADVPDVRVVPRDNLHVTLAFFGARPAAEVPAIVDAMQASAAETELEFTVRRYRETPRVGMLSLDWQGRLGEFRARFEGLGLDTHSRAVWHPHITVIRFRQAPRLRPAVPDLGTFSPSEAAVYHSVLRGSGAQYEILETAALGG